MELRVLGVFPVEQDRRGGDGVAEAPGAAAAALAPTNAVLQLTFKISPPLVLVGAISEPRKGC